MASIFLNGLAFQLCVAGLPASLALLHGIPITKADTGGTADGYAEEHIHNVFSQAIKGIDTNKLARTAALDAF